MFKYSTEKKRLYYNKVIKLYRDEHLGCRQISKILPIARSTISEWIRNFVAENPSYRRPYMKVSPRRSSSTSKDSVSSEPDLANANAEELRKELAILRKKLSDAELKAEIYNEMINVAESKFKISIRKKAGTK